MLLGSRPSDLEDATLVKPTAHRSNTSSRSLDKIRIDRRPEKPVEATAPPTTGTTLTRTLVAADAAVPAVTAVSAAHGTLFQRPFGKALKNNNHDALKRCLEAGYIPSDSQWLTIISRLHVKSALSCVRLARNLSTQCVAAAVRRQHKKLFKEVVTRVDVIPRSQIDALMVAPAYYLDICLTRGLDPNIKLKNHRLPLEHACAHSRIAHIEILLNDTRTTVSQNVCRFMIRQTKIQQFAEKAIELCDNIVPDMILEAIVANVTSALCSIMSKLEESCEKMNSWNEITHLLKCPISQDYSTDLVKTPINNHYYDRVQLLTWVRSKGTDPQTRAPLQESDLLLRSEFLAEYAHTLQKKIQELDTITV